MRREPLLLAVTPHGLLACIGHGDGLQLLAAFMPGEEAGFASWLARRTPDEPCRVLVDLPDEAYEIEDLPRVRGGDRRALLARRLAHWFPEPRFARASALGVPPDGRKGFERVLFAGLERGAELLPWLERLEADGRRPELLAPAAALLPRLPLPDARQRRRGKAPSHPRLVAAAGRAGLRIALLEGDHTLFSRLVHAHAETLADPQALADEVERTRDYLLAQHRIAPDAPLDRVVVDLPAPAGAEQATLPTVGIVAPDTLAADERPGTCDAHLLLALRRAPTTLGWPLAARARRWPLLPERRVLAALALAASAILGAAAWMEQRAQAEAEALAAAERARAARAAALAAEEAELAAREAERAARAALDVEPPPPATAAMVAPEPEPPPPPAAEPAACPPAYSPPPAPIARRIDGILRRPDGEVLLWVEGSWQSARTLGLRPATGEAAAVSPPGRRTRLRSGDSMPVELATLTVGAAQPHPEHEHAAAGARETTPDAHPAQPDPGTAGPALAAAQPALMTATPALAASGARP